MSVIGYEFLREAHELPAFPVSAPARPGGYTHVHRLPDGSLAVPRAVAPSSNDVLEHILFALRYEGTNLQVLSHALLRVPARAMAEAVAATPNGAFVRKAAFLWEYFNAQQLSVATPVGGGYTDLFDPSEYFVGPAQRTARWRVNFNGLGSLDYCVSVRRTPAIEELSGKRPLERARSFAQEIGPAMLDRALAWAYLSETESSFAIEREAPSEDKARTFVRMLKQAHAGCRNHQRPAGGLDHVQLQGVDGAARLAGTVRSRRRASHFVGFLRLVLAHRQTGPGILAERVGKAGHCLCVGGGAGQEGRTWQLYGSLARSARVYRRTDVLLH